MGSYALPTRSSLRVEPEVDQQPESETLALAAQRGDRRALSALLERHKHEAYRVALRIVGRAADADEVLQNALERLLKHLHRYDPNRPFRPWLLRIVVNQARSFWRRKKLETLVFSENIEGRFARGPQEELCSRELSDLLCEALLALPRDQREAFVLKHIEELSYEEMAVVIGEAPGALRVRVHRARRAVLAWCNARGVTFSSLVR